MTVRSGYIHGTGSAINVELGYIPDAVILTLQSGTIRQYHCVLDKVVVFTSGGVAEVKAGDTLTGATSGATAKVREVILDSGTWAGGDAAGWFICDHEDISGTIATENVNQSGSGTQTNIAAVVVDVEYGVDIDTEIAVVTGNAGCLGYKGDATTSPPYAKGFTVGSTISVNGILIHYLAFKSDGGESQGPRVLGNQQSTLW